MDGMALCEAFFIECVEPVLSGAFPALAYSAGRLGSGSDVIGYDDEVSRDHDWGPRLHVFPKEYSDGLKDEIESALKRELPRMFRGFSVGFSAPDMRGISAMSKGADEFRPRVKVMPFSAFLMGEIGRPNADDITPAEWLAFSEHRLLTLTRGRLFRDDLGLKKELKKLAAYPRDVWLYLLYSDWSAVAEERAFVKRAAAREDDLGSRIVAARIAHRLMHLAFLYEGRFAAYSKWFGTAFQELSTYSVLEPMLSRALHAHHREERELSIARAQAILIEIHNESGLTPPVDPSIHPYYTRDIKVASSDAVADIIHDLIEDATLKALPPIGSLSSVGNLTVLCEDAKNLARLTNLYR
jgi:hypothetical protein